MSSGEQRLIVNCVVGFGMGIYWFFRGFQIYRKYRVLADTPEIPIRSIAMGLAEVYGKAKGDQLVWGPLTGTRCFFYQVLIEKWVESKALSCWTHYKTDAGGTKFYLEDATGHVLVDAHGAECDLPQAGRFEVESGCVQREFGPSGPGVGLEGYIARNCGSGSERHRLTESCILPGHRYDVTGTCTENPNSKEGHDRNLIKKGENEPTFLISWRSEKEIETTLRARAELHIFGGAALSVVCLGFLLKKFGWL